MKTVTCTALTFFIEYVPEHGQVHGDPNSDDKAVRFPEVPECAVERMVEAGQIKAGGPKGKRGKAEQSEPAEPEGDAPADEGETATEDAAPV
jgi:hypothetical protein